VIKKKETRSRGKNLLTTALCTALEQRTESKKKTTQHEPTKGRGPLKVGDKKYVSIRKKKKERREQQREKERRGRSKNTNPNC